MTYPLIEAGEFMVRRNGSIDPAKFPDEEFELHSIPAFDAGMPEVLRGSEIGSSKQIVQPGDVMISKIVPHIRRSSVVGPATGRRQIASSEWIIFRSEAFWPNYLRHLLVSDEFNAKFMRTVSGVGGSLLRARPAEVAKIKVPVPSLAEQRRIAAILDKAEVLRAKRRESIAKLDQLLQSVFLDMFGDPLTNPLGLPAARLDSVCALVNGRAFKPEEWESAGLPIIRIQNLNDASKPFNYTSQDLPEKYRVRNGDVLFSWSGTPGTSFGCFRWTGPEGWLNQHIFNVRLNGVVNEDYFIHQLNLKLAELIGKAHGGVGLQHVTKRMVDETMLMIAPIFAQRKFASIVEKVGEQKRTLLRQRQAASAMFASLQHRAFAGTL